MSVGMTLIGWYLRYSRKPIWSNASRFLANEAGPKANPEPPETLTRVHEITKRTIAGFVTYTVKPRQPSGVIRAVMYLHGGGYVNEIAPQHWALIGRMADAGLTVEVPIYGLMPTCTWADAYRFVPAVYQEMLRRHGEGNVILAGDSAGGGLALGLTSVLPDLKMPAPHSLMLISPWLDVTCSNPEIHAVEPRDPWLGLVGARIAGEHWSRDGDPLDPRISPLHMDISRLPPTTIYCGTHDIVYPDIRLFRGRSPKVDLITCDGACHVYPLLPVPEGKQAAQEIVEQLTKAARA
ncbi:alpha/beta hydrolase [Hydrogenophaga sp. 5NK40-0174]|uniref:alpha/beta hydrolase n=1 Tax=Hydrogenophaga sp. 5NK40-0174 TaxID=3127649 RepID=UPI003106790D